MADNNDIELDEIAKAALMGAAEEMIGESSPDAASGIGMLGAAANEANGSLKQTANSLSEIQKHITQLQKESITSVKDVFAAVNSDSSTTPKLSGASHSHPQRFEQSIIEDGGQKHIERVTDEREIEEAIRSAAREHMLDYLNTYRGEFGGEKITSKPLLLGYNPKYSSSSIYGNGENPMDKGLKEYNEWLAALKEAEAKSPMRRAEQMVGRVSFTNGEDRAFSDMIEQSRSIKENAERMAEIRRIYEEDLLNQKKAAEPKSYRSTPSVIDRGSERIIASQLEKQQRLYEEARAEVEAKAKNIATIKFEENEYKNRDIYEVEKRELRNMYAVFLDMAKNIRHDRDPLATESEKNLRVKYNNLTSKIGVWEETLDENGKPMDGGGHWSDKSMMQKLSGMANEISVNERNVAQIKDKESVQYKDALAKLNMSREDFVEEIKKSKESMHKSLEDLANDINTETKKNKQSRYENPLEARYSRYWDDPRYALVRDKEQKEEWRREFHYNTTGNLKDSFTKTIYNQSVGMRQRRGLEGFLSNIGYNNSGTLQSIAFGAIGKGITDLGSAIIQLGKDSIQAYSEIQTIRTNLGIVYGSQSEADQTFEQIANYSVKSPFGVKTVSEFAVLLKQSGVYASDLMDTMKQIGDVAGGNQQKFGNIANAFAQIEANGKATTRQLRQFATAGIPIYKELADYLGITVSEVRNRTSKSMISAQDIEAVFSKMTSNGGIFENAVNIGAKTIAARKQNLEDAAQLAKSEVGEWVVNIGRTSISESYYKQVLSLLEGLWGGVKNIVDKANTKNDKQVYKTNSEQIEELEGVIQTLSQYEGNDEAITVLYKELAELKSRFTEDEKLANALKVYNENVKKAQGESLNRDTEWKLKTYTEGFEENFVRRNGSFYKMDEVGYYNEITAEEYSKALQENTIAVQTLNNTYSQEEIKTAKENIKDIVPLAIQALVSGYGSTIKESFEKKANKNDKSLQNYAIKSRSEYEGTTKGKLELQATEKEEWENARKKYEEYIKYLKTDSEGVARLGGSKKISLDKFNDIVKSGIFTNTEKISTKVSDLAKETVVAPTYTERNEETLKRDESWNTLRENIQSLRALDVSGLDSEVLSPLLNFADNIMHKGSNTKQNVQNLNNIINDALNNAEKINNPSLYNAIGSVLTKSNVAGEILPYDELQDSKGKSYDPLWRRVLSQGLGTDLTLMRKNNMSAKDILGLFTQNNQRALAKTITKAMLQSGSSVSAVKANFKYQDGYNSYDGTKRSDWKETSKNFSNFAMAMASATSVTEAYVNQVQSEIDSLDETFASALTQVEEGANIYDPNYAEFLGDFKESLSATEFAAFSTSIENATTAAGNLKDGFIDAYEKLRNEKNQQLIDAKVLASRKNLTDEYDKSKNTSKIDKLSKLYARYSGVELKNVKMDEFYQSAFSADYNAKSNNGKDKAVRPEDVARDFIKSYTNKDDSLKTEIDKIESLKSDIKDYKSKIAINDISIAYNKETKSRADKNFSRRFDKTLAQASLTAEQNIKNDEAENKAYRAKLATAEAELEVAESALEAKNKIAALALSAEEAAKAVKDSLAIDVLNTIAPTRKEDESDSPLWDSYKRGMQAEYFGFNTEGNNTVKQQFGLNYLAEQTGDNSLRESNFRDISYRMLGVDPDKYEGKTVDLDTNTSEYQNFESIKQAFLETAKNNGKEDWANELVSSSYSGISLDDNGISTLGDIDLTAFEQMVEYLSESKAISASIGDQFKSIGTNMASMFKSQATSGLVNSSMLIGKHLRDGSDASEDLSKNWKAVGAAMLEQTSQLMINAGLNMIATAGAGNKSQIIAGLALAAAGGCAGILSGMLSDDKEDKTSQADETSKLEKLKDMLKDLIDQAKEDANYYERNYLHKQALSTNANMSSSTVASSVHDAIISPDGRVITTDPMDYLIATKTPNALMKGAGQSAVNDIKINFQVINQGNANVQVKKIQQNNNSDGTTDITAVIIATAGQAIAEGSLDGAFSIRDARMKGNSYTV